MKEVWSDLTVGSLSALLLTAILLATGERVRRLLRMPCPPSIRPALAWGLGSWSIGLVVLLLGLIGLFRPAPLLATIAAAAALGSWSGLLASAKKLLMFALGGLPLIVVALAPPFFYDAWVYHLGLPWQALQDGVIRAHPGNLFSTFPPLAQLIYAVPLAAGAVRAPALLHLFGYCTAAIAAQGLASRLGASRLPASLAGLCVLYLPVAPLVAGFPAAEAWTVSCVLASVALALTARAGPKSSLAAGWMVGVAAAARMQGLSWAVLCAPLVAARRRKPLASLAAFAIAAVIGSAPWWLKNGLLLHDPFAPLGWHREGIETLWRDAKSSLHLAANASDLARRSLASLVEQAWLLILLLAAALAATVTRRRLPVLLLVATASAGALAWSLTGALPRFLVPSLVLLLTAAACGQRRPGVIGSLGAIGLTLVTGLSSSLGMFRQLGGFSVMGRSSEVYQALVVSDPYPAFLTCAGLPEGARVLLISEPRGFLLPRRFETSSQHDRTALVTLLQAQASPEAVRALLVKMGYSHLLVNVAEMRRLGRNYPVLPWTDPDSRSAFVALTRHLEPPAFVSGEMVVYSLNPKSAE